MEETPVAEFPEKALDPLSRVIARSRPHAGTLRRNPDFRRLDEGYRIARPST